MNKIKQYKYIIITILALVILGCIFYRIQLKPSQTSTTPEVPKGTVDINKFEDAIKYAESDNPPRIGASPTEEEIKNSPHIKQIRIALNGYLDGTNTGLEVEALNNISTDMKCGLDNFSKTYYRSKFVVLGAEDSDYGGINAYISFVDKPDTVFWVWVYGIVGGQRLRAFCEQPITTQSEADYVSGAIKVSKYSF